VLVFHDITLTQAVNSALKQYHSILALSRSPLANSPLITPALIFDTVSPTTGERGHALRLVLQWAVGLLAPEPVRFEFGEDRPYDDPTWRDPRWWRYNILRHRYLEPLHPDEFIEGGRYTETLIALTGIPNADAFFDERNRAIRDVTDWLQQQLQSGVANETLRRMALEEAIRQLDRQPLLRQLLDIASTFDEVFPRLLLLDLTKDEQLPKIDRTLAQAITQRFLLTDDSEADLWLSPVLQAFLYQRQNESQVKRRHQRAAHYYASHGEALRAAEHWQRSDQWGRAATTLLAAAPELVNELQVNELWSALLTFKVGQLPSELWREVQFLVVDLAIRLGQREAGLAACRRALQVSTESTQQARIYRRMGKLYEPYNQRHALEYYQQAAEHFAPDDLEYVILLKDRAWLYILRRDWAPAEADLLQALTRSQQQNPELQADIYDALAHLNQSHNFERAVQFARTALKLRERVGNLARIADSYNNLGLLYNKMGDYDSALATLSEALTLYRKLGNQERLGGLFVNIGMAHHLLGKRIEAIQAYNESIPLLSEAKQRLILSRAHYNLAEAHAELDNVDQARAHWLQCYQICVDAGFDEELRDLEELRLQFTALAPMVDQREQPTEALVHDHSELTSEEQQVLELARRDGQITPKKLMLFANVSKATATRRLSDLAQRGLLWQQGKGRATMYTLPNATLQQGPTSSARQNPPVMASIEHLLREHAHDLLAQFGVIAFGMCHPPPVESSLALLVRFHVQPTMSVFLELEHWLSMLYAQRVDLIVADWCSLEGMKSTLTWLTIEEELLIGS
jgi:tetratricopeptide (TPR) repeat protein/predicted nucleotidyltransferase